MATRRRYSDDDRAAALAALAANGGNVARTAARLGIPVKTLANWARGDRHPEAAQLGERKKGDMAAALEAVAWQILDALPHKIGKAPLNQAAVALGIAIDKARLLRGEPTEIRRDDLPGLDALLHDPAAAAHAAALLERLTARPDDPGRAGLVREPGEVGQPAAPHPPQP